MNEQRPKELHSGQLVASVSPVVQVLAETTYWHSFPYTFDGQTHVAPVDVIWQDPPFWQIKLEQSETPDETVVVVVVTAGTVMIGADVVLAVINWVHWMPVYPSYRI